MSRQYNFKEKEVLEAIKNSGGIVSTIQKKLGCDSWSTANKFILKWESTKQAFDDEQEKIIDIAEGALIKSIQEGNTQDGKWYLSKKGKHRGYADEGTVVNVTNEISKTNEKEIKHNLDKLTPEERDLYFELCGKMNDTDSE